ncbi:MAG: S49 family peptidase [Phycisphaeraceae bacterium]
MADTPDPANTPSGRPPVDPAGAATPPPPPPAYAYAPPPAQQPKGGSYIRRALTSLLFTILLISLLTNFYLGSMVYQLTSGPRESVYQAGTSEQRIVIIPIDGMIGDDTQRFVREALKQLRDNPPAAIILRVNSGGGGVGPSDRIYEALRTYRTEMEQEHGRDVPVIASFGSVAASGGYYIAMVADTIIAERTSITGSIGVMAPAFTIHNMLDKIGVTPEIIESTRSPKKDIANNIARPWDEVDREKVRQILDSAYERFVDVVYEGRQSVLTTREAVIEVADGEALTSDQAKQKKLIDRIGYLSDAIDAAATAAGLQDPRVTQIQPARGFSLAALLHADPPRAADLDLSAERVRNWVLEGAAPRLMYWSGIGG